jgi:hypothetical protein
LIFTGYWSFFSYDHISNLSFPRTGVFAGSTKAILPAVLPWPGMLRPGPTVAVYTEGGEGAVFFFKSGAEVVVLLFVRLVKG